MTRLEAPLRVALESSWWSQALPFAALIVSLVSIGLTLWFRYSDSLKVDVTAHVAYMTGGTADGSLVVTVTVINRSRQQSTVVRQIALESSSGSGILAWNVPWNDALEARLPRSLGPGEQAVQFFPLEDVQREAHKHFRSARWARARAVTGHKTFFSRKDEALLARLVLG